MMDTVFAQVYKGVLIKFQLRRRIADQQVMFGCLDTWLLWQLTGRKVYATDYSNASVTMLFDPFQVSMELLHVDIYRAMHYSAKHGIAIARLPSVCDVGGL